MTRSRRQAVFFFLAFLVLFLVFPGERVALAEGNGAGPDGPARGSLTLNIMGKEGIKAQTRAQIYEEQGQTPVAAVKAGETVELKPGIYRVELEVLGGRVTKSGVLIRAGRKRTLFITEVALLSKGPLRPC